MPSYAILILCGTQIEELREHLNAYEKLKGPIDNSAATSDDNPYSHTGRNKSLDE